MRFYKRLSALLPIHLLVLPVPATAAQLPRCEARQVVPIWPGKAPGTEDWTAPEEAEDVTLRTVGKNPRYYEHYRPIADDLPSGTQQSKWHSDRRVAGRLIPSAGIPASTARWD